MDNTTEASACWCFDCPLKPSHMLLTVFEYSDCVVHTQVLLYLYIYTSGIVTHLRTLYSLADMICTGICRIISTAANMEGTPSSLYKKYETTSRRIGLIKI